jgi:hypothetical protein
MDWKTLVDKTLGTHFNAPVYKAETGRAKLVSVIDKAAEQHKEGKNASHAVVEAWQQQCDQLCSHAERQSRAATGRCGQLRASRAVPGLSQRAQSRRAGW